MNTSSNNTRSERFDTIAGVILVIAILAVIGKCVSSHSSTAPRIAEAGSPGSQGSMTVEQAQYQRALDARAAQLQQQAQYQDAARALDQADREAQRRQTAQRTSVLVVCPGCGGAGKFTDGSMCRTCYGRGTIKAGHPGEMLP